MMSNDSALCPVASFRKYLFQRSKTRKVYEDEVWYDNIVLGENTLGKKTDESNLTATYTNHSIRSTAVTILD